MLVQVLVGGGVFILAVLMTALVVLLGVRARVPLAVDLLRRFSRLFRPFQMKTAGRPGAYASVVRHRGRRSGRQYETPVGAAATEDGFVIALPYGSRAHWVRNVLASGSAVIVSDAHEYQVVEPELIPLESVATAFSVSDQRSHHWFGVQECLRLRRVVGSQAAA
jgi:deazaflavin-dependent oxidoreductase (nitroreductase family)